MGAGKLENVYQIRIKKNLNFILPVLVRNNPDTDIPKGEMAVFIHLHYWDTVDRYLEYIKEVPGAIDLYISTSEEKTKKVLEDKISAYGIDHCKVIEKTNRGRDISALLVTYSEMISKYRYICFLHDKKAKGDYDFTYKNNWIISMWENMISTGDYIYNVKDVFDNHPGLGILAVPEPFSTRVNAAFENSWGENFPQAVKIADQLGLHCELDSEVPPITLGTVFWCRTAALKKLFEYPWKYEDFPEEPMPNDGTISHALERIFAYVAQDAGYDTGTVRTVSCAEKQIMFMQDALRISFLRMKKLGIENINDAINYEKRKRMCENFFQKFDDIYLYGAGSYGRKSLHLLNSVGLQPKGFIISHKDAGYPELEGFPIRELGEIELHEKVGIIITVRAMHLDEIIGILEKKGFHNYVWIYGGRRC